jgi:hypothetical protein
MRRKIIYMTHVDYLRGAEVTSIHRYSLHRYFRILQSRR